MIILALMAVGILGALLLLAYVCTLASENGVPDFVIVLTCAAAIIWMVS